MSLLLFLFSITVDFKWDEPACDVNNERYCDIDGYSLEWKEISSDWSEPLSGQTVDARDSTQFTLEVDGENDFYAVVRAYKKHGDQVVYSEPSNEVKVLGKRQAPRNLSIQELR